MLFYRQKILLVLLEALGGRVGATDFQKLLFLYVTLCEEDGSYDFVPFRFGCFSFQAMADKRKLIEKQYLSDDKEWVIDSNVSFALGLKPSDLKKVNIFVERFSSKRGPELIKHVYEKYPHTAINSEIAEKHLTKDQYKKVLALKPKFKDSKLFATIGYEGESVDAYLMRLVENGVKLLIDVRKNPLSRKYGFSKKALLSLTGKLGIEYIHIPEMGIESVDRKSLNSQADYMALFKVYEKTVLKSEVKSLDRIIDLYYEHNRVAITCFEKDQCMCHRGNIATAVSKKSKGEIQITHL